MKLLLIEDERELSQNIVLFLESNYLCEQAFTFQEAIEKLKLYTYDCILLDLGLPGGDGLLLLEEIKKLHLDSSILIISARNALEDKILGLELGADDYLAKPFALPELSIRIHAQLRRRLATTTNELTSSNITINLLSKQVTVNGESVLLTKSEYALLLFLIGNKKRVISKNAIAEHLSGDMADMLDNQNFVYAHIKNLKAKLQDHQCKGSIKTIYGTGYQWIEE
ncbi:response regulator transcription factor [Myroides sp. WP-1]|uniref:response regulator transcription factor n=1 Tax=Myroides sp. WP-1 TaxID=2759944 RepID=UPI0015FD64A7|nr:response regulator transcription factor [Myroides sp. WP-1]MBB1140502.1 response regulator transcription factor [Myroides sp. WP-1]